MSTDLAIWLGATVAALVAVVWTGKAAQRGAHYVSVGAFFACLFLAIRAAGEVGRGLTYEGWARAVFYVHFSFVALVFLMVPFLLVSGIQLAKLEEPERRRRHNRLAAMFVGLVVLTCVLGTLMTWGATPVEAA